MGLLAHITWRIHDGTAEIYGGQVGGVYATMGLAALFMPGLMGIVADRWINAERVLGICHLVGAILLFWASTVTNPVVMYWVMLFNAMAYMPTIALNSAVSYNILLQKGYDVVKDFPPIRVWGTIGFIFCHVDRRSSGLGQKSRSTLRQCSYSPILRYLLLYYACMSSCTRQKRRINSLRAWPGCLCFV